MLNCRLDYCGDIVLNYLLRACVTQAGIKYAVAITRDSIFIKAMMIINYTYESSQLLR